MTTTTATAALPATKTVNGITVYLVYGHTGRPVYVSVPENDPSNWAEATAMLNDKGGA